MKHQTATVRELRRLLFENDKLDVVLFGKELSADDARRELFERADQEEVLSYRFDGYVYFIESGTHDEQ